MNKTQKIVIGFAGVAAATVMGASLLGGNPNTSPNPEKSGGEGNNTSYQEQSTSSGEMQQYFDQIRAMDKEKQKLLEGIVFYQGNATIQETYKAPLGLTGDTPVDGSAAMISEDVIAFDEKTGKGFLIARRIALLGDGMVTFEAMRGTTETAMVKVTGILTEYYGNGIIKAYDVADALQGNKGYYLDFSANPVRFDRATESIFTNPPVKNTYWVQIIGYNGVSLVATGVFTPEELPYVEVGLIPGLSHLWDEKSYNSKETQIYEYTGGLFVPQGVFSFDYKKTSYDEVKDFLDELRDEAQKDKQLEEAAQNLSDAWKETLRAEQELSVIRDVFNGIGTTTDGYFGDSEIEPASANNNADAFAHSNEVQSEIDRANDSLENIESSEGTLRKLEDFSLEGGDEDKQQAQKAMGEMLPLLKKTIVSTREILERLQTEKDALALMVEAGKPQEDVLRKIQSVRGITAEFERFKNGVDLMSGDFAYALLGYVHADPKTKTEYAALAELCKTWKSTLEQTLSGTAPLVDIQSGVLIPDTYPVHVVPLLKSFVAAMYQQDADGTIMLTLKTDTTPELVMDYYRLALNDADNVSEVSMAGMLIFSAEKEDYEISIMAGANQMGGIESTMVQITLVPMM